MASGTRPVQVQETPPEETYKVETYGTDSLGIGCAHNSQWDFFWNPYTPWTITC